MKRSLTVALAAALVVTASAGMSSCATLGLKKPEITYKTTRFVAANFEQLRVDLVFNLRNPYPFGIKLDAYRMFFQVDGLTLLDGVINRPLDMRGGRTTELVFPITVKWTELIAKIQQGFSSDGLPYKVAGDVRLNTGTKLGQLKLPFRVTGRMPVIQAPKIGLKGLRLGKASLSAVDLIVDMEMANSGTAIKLADLAYNLKLAGTPVVSSSLSKPVPVGSRGKALQSFKVSLSPAKFGIALIQSLIAGKPISASFGGTTKVDTGFGVIPLNFSDLENLIPKR